MNTEIDPLPVKNNRHEHAFEPDAKPFGLGKIAAARSC